jgi:HlyD family secretion protein
MKTFHLRASAVTLLLGAGLLALSIEDAAKSDHQGFLSSAHAQPLRKLIARLRGQTLPDGIEKAEGRIEATQADVSSKYPGQLAEISVEEGTKVAIGQVIGRVSSPEFEARLRGAQSDLQAAYDGLAAAESEITSRRSALESAKSDFERGQALMKSGFIAKQSFEERQRNYESADAAVQNMIARRDQAKNAILIAEANVQKIEAMIHDLALTSPKNGQVQYQLVRKGETVAAGEPIVTILDLTDVYMVIFLKAAGAGRLGIGDEARVILDAVPDYIIPAEVSFVASEAQFTPKTVETEAEREKLMFRVQLRIDRQVLQRYYGRVETGLRGSGFVRTKPDAEWPAQLEVKLPPEPASLAVAETSAPAPNAVQTPTPPPALAPAAQTSAPALASSPVPQTPTAAPAPPITQTATPAPASSVATQTPTPAPTAQTPTPAPAVEPATPTQIARTPMPATDLAPAAEQQESPPDFAPESITQLIGAWASSDADCSRLFERRGRALAYRQPVDKFAQAAIVESQRIRLPSAVCQVESASHEGGALKLDAECQDSISYTSRTVHVKLRSDTEIFYSPTGDPVLGTALMKCHL